MSGRAVDYPMWTEPVTIASDLSVALSKQRVGAELVRCDVKTVTVELVPLSSTGGERDPARDGASREIQMEVHPDQCPGGQRFRKVVEKSDMAGHAGAIDRLGESGADGGGHEKPQLPRWPRQRQTRFWPAKVVAIFSAWPPPSTSPLTNLAQVGAYFN